MRCVSICSGIGGIELGLSLVEQIHPVLFVEPDKYCQQVLARRWPDVELADRVEELYLAPGWADIVTAGFPCQPWSLAGSQKGVNDERWIWPAIFRAICALRPCRVFLENVPAIISGGGLPIILADLASVGFDAVWSVFSFRELGAPHHRRRFFMLAYPSGERLRLTRRPIIEKQSQPSRLPGVLADPNGLFKAAFRKRLLQREEVQPSAGRQDCDLADSDNAKPGQRPSPSKQPKLARHVRGFWPPGPTEDWSGCEISPAKPRVHRVANGFPSPLERSQYRARVRSLGNAVSPPVAAYAYLKLTEEMHRHAKA